MGSLKQNSFAGSTATAAYNEPIMQHEPHLACVLLLDTSGSMHGERVASLNRGLADFIAQTQKDDFAMKRVEISLIEFNSSANTILDFTPLPEMEPVTLVAGGQTAMGEGIKLAIKTVKERKALYNSIGVPFFTPWIFMISDGIPTDSADVIDSARNDLFAEYAKGSHGVKFIPVGVPGYDRNLLASLSKTKTCLEMDDANFEGIFNWLSESMVIVSHSKPGLTPDLNTLPDNVRKVSLEDF